MNAPKTQSLSLQELINQHGIPPTEVCLDWAFQVQEIDSRRARNSDVSPEDLDEVLAHVGVDSQGRLQVPDSVNCSGLAHQFLLWADGPHQATAPGIGDSEVRQLKGMLDASASKSDPRASRSTQPGSPLLVKSDAVDGKVRSAARAKARKSGPKPLVLWAIGTVAGLIVLAAVWFSWPTNSVDLAQSNANATPAVNVEQDRTNGGADDSELTMLDSLDHSELPTDGQDESSSDTAADVLAGLAADFDASVGTAPATAPAPGNKSNDATSGVGNLEVPQVADDLKLETLPDALAERSGPVGELVDEEPIDVLSQLEGIQFDEKPANVQVPYPGDAGESQSKPLVIGLVPVVQTQKVDVPRGTRVREPRWSVGLVSSEGLTVSPNAPVELKRRQPALWEITAKEGDLESDAKIAVMAELLTASWTVRWTTVLRSSKYPAVRLPLSDAYLNQAETILINIVKRLSTQEAMLDAMAKNRSLPAESKAVARRRSAAVGEQLELAQAMLQIALDGKRLIGWSDGLLEVHAEVYDDRRSSDQGGPGSVVVSFGDFKAATNRGNSKNANKSDAENMSGDAMSGDDGDAK